MEMANGIRVLVDQKKRKTSVTEVDEQFLDYLSLWGNIMHGRSSSGVRFVAKANLLKIGETVRSTARDSKHDVAHGSRSSFVPLLSLRTSEDDTNNANQNSCHEYDDDDGRVAARSPCNEEDDFNIPP